MGAGVGHRVSPPTSSYSYVFVPILYQITNLNRSIMGSCFSNDHIVGGHIHTLRNHNRSITLDGGMDG